MLNAILTYEKKKLTHYTYYKHRAVLIGEIIYRNAQRTGVATGMKISEVEDSEMCGNIRKIKVFQHKTGKTKPAVVFLDELASKAMMHFKDEILRQIDSLGKSGEEYIFVSFEGNKITSQGVQNSLKLILKGIGIEDKITPTASRIAAATHIATQTPHISQLVADYMGHQPSTAEKYYREIGGGDHLIGAYEAIGASPNKQILNI